jgi:hypothetical protein
MFNEYETIHAVGCGPSAKPWLPELSVKPNVVAVNSMGPLLNPPFWVMVDPIRDASIIQWASSREDVAYYCTRYNVEQLPQRNKFLMRTVGTRVMGEPWKDGFFMLRSSLVTACHVAWSLGAERVIVWGLDMSPDHGRCNGDRGEAWRNMESIREGWRRLRDGLRDLKCEVLNANPDSGIAELDFIDPGKAIGE